ncbi:putative serine/threonine-protein kinase [Tetrabaena socialis]|uniref:Putative serine/threonine-protein kinase n=1 Tax=Tetrabaena socialis TaxID=47790 RepID=A0A2J8A0A9_9CHLO|nr:putative serine/threonine-protein kinase [Tetrabaena socialis]|eukprot:PNH05963.1 putative serine/threonine-protein kinase [Tetrabaena socialis]
MWSLGCVLYEMAARRTAFEAFGLPQLMFKILRTAYEPLPPQFSRPFQQLVNCMLRADPDDRPTTQDLLAHPFVRRYLARLLTLGSPQPQSAPGKAAQGRPSAMPPVINPWEARSAVKRMERATALADRSKASSAGSGPGGKRRRAAAAAAAAAAAGGGSGAATAADGGAAADGEGGGGGAGGRPASGSPRSPGAGGGGGGGGGSGGVQPSQWDSGARYEARRQAQVEMRFKAREFEQRITREQVRQQRRERDPAVRAREAELELLRLELMARRERKHAQAAEQQILAERLGPEGAEAGEGGDDALAAFRTRARLARTQLAGGLAPLEAGDEDAEAAALLDDMRRELLEQAAEDGRAEEERQRHRAELGGSAEWQEAVLSLGRRGTEPGAAAAAAPRPSQPPAMHAAAAAPGPVHPAVPRTAAAAPTAASSTTTAAAAPASAAAAAGPGDPERPMTALRAAATAGLRRPIHDGTGRPCQLQWWWPEPAPGKRAAQPFSASRFARADSGPIVPRAHEAVAQLRLSWRDCLLPQ